MYADFTTADSDEIIIVVEVGVSDASPNKKTTLNIEETLTLNLRFKYGDKTRDEIAEITMCVIDMPGKSIIIGLPDIIAYFYYVFIDMINEARTLIQNRKYHTSTKLPEEEILNIDLKLPL